MKLGPSGFFSKAWFKKKKDHANFLGVPQEYAGCYKLCLFKIA